MRTIPADLLAHLQGEVTTLAVCWRVERRDGVLILGTEHDADITIDQGSPTAQFAGTYVAQAGITGSNVRSTSDMSVDNMEVTGAVNTGDLNLVDLSPADIEAGLFDDASVVLFLVNWQAPDDGQIILRTGTIGAITRTAEGQYKTELRGLAQRLSQNIVRTYGSGCDAELGDARCGVDLTQFTFAGVVTEIHNRRRFYADVDTATAPESMAIELYLPMPYDVEVGDTFTIAHGCNKEWATCKWRFDNLVNFRGHGAWVPGMDELMTFGGQTATRGASTEPTEKEWLTRVAFEAADKPAMDSPPDIADVFMGGLLVWTGGANQGFSMEVKLAIIAEPATDWPW